MQLSQGIVCIFDVLKLRLDIGHFQQFVLKNVSLVSRKAESWVCLILGEFPSVGSQLVHKIRVGP